MIPLLVITQERKSLQQFLQKKSKEERSNVITLTPLASEYSIQQIREIGIELKVSQPIRQIYVLENFESSSLEAQNAFLKLLEEPPHNVEFILVVSNPYSLLPTIISRTKIVRLEKRKQFSSDSRIRNALDELVTRKNLHSFDFSLFTSPTKEEALSSLIQMCVCFRERFPTDPLSTTIVKEVLFTYQLIKNNNLNPQLALDHLLIFISKQYSMK